MHVVARDSLAIQLRTLSRRGYGHPKDFSRTALALAGLKKPEIAHNLGLQNHVFVQRRPWASSIGAPSVHESCIPVKMLCLGF